MAAELNLLTKHATAASTVQMKDQDKIWRVVVNLASHPRCRVHRPGGVEVKATREEIRRLAGVERRSASRAFHLFQERDWLSSAATNVSSFAHGKEGPLMPTEANIAVSKIAFAYAESPDDYIRAGGKA